MAGERILSMLFSDIRGFSNIRNDDLKVRLERFLKKDILEHLLTPENHIYFNPWGDAFFICSENPVALAELGLQIRDKFRHQDWIRFGLREALAVRVALHAQTVRLVNNPDGTIRDVTGAGVDTTARMEPVTAPNEVFCSELFHQLLTQAGPANINTVPVGKKQLAKGFGEMNLYRLAWTAEVLPGPAHAEGERQSMPRVRRKPTDRERADFLYDAFGKLQAYLQSALEQLAMSDSHVETSLRPISNTKFLCEIYLDGHLVNRCKVWIGGLFAGSSISYTEGRFDLDNDNSLQESLQVEDDGFDFFLKPMMGTMYGVMNDKMTSQQAAEYLWKRFTNQLGQ